MTVQGSAREHEIAPFVDQNDRFQEIDFSSLPKQVCPDRLGGFASQFSVDISVCARTGRQ